MGVCSCSPPQGPSLEEVDDGAEATGADEIVTHSSPFLSFSCNHVGVIGLVLAMSRRIQKSLYFLKLSRFLSFPLPG